MSAASGMAAQPKRRPVFVRTAAPMTEDRVWPEEREQFSGKAISGWTFWV